MKRLAAPSVGSVILLALLAWAPRATAYEDFGATGENCKACHEIFAGGTSNTAHQAHATGNDCGACHGGFPPALSTCTQCHSQAGLVEHHTNAEVTGFPDPGLSCAQCHGGLTPEPEDTVPSGYAGTGLDPCDGSEEQFPSLTVSLDNDGDLCYDVTDSDCGGMEAVCDDGMDNDCDGQTDSEDPDCAAEPECTVDADCDDGAFCNGEETCDNTGTCQPGTPPDCDDGVDCTADSCDEASDTCVNELVNANCDDADPCTVDVCEPELGCIYSSTCPEDQTCDPTDGSCTPLAECQTDAECDDGLFCNGMEFCDGATGTCQSGAAPDCDDGVRCTEDECDEVNDTCMNVPSAANCDDGEFCNGAEICDPVSDCQPGAEPCAEGELCDEVNDTCAPSTECSTDEACDDGLFCNGVEFCDDSGACAPGTVPCATGETCNEETDTCEAAVGKVAICHMPRGNPARAKSRCIDAESVFDHLGHGDTLGPCPGDEEIVCERRGRGD